mmetsp:Transcript_18832/g.35739  ORF Transcript_18832/g.35739 Transcript_18832/m.35739 type:complete len:88 (+) Transcript_18832:106-369(+)
MRDALGRVSFGRFKKVGWVVSLPDHSCCVKFRKHETNNQRHSELCIFIEDFAPKENEVSQHFRSPMLNCPLTSNGAMLNYPPIWNGT